MNVRSILIIGLIPWAVWILINIVTYMHEYSRDTIVMPNGRTAWITISSPGADAIINSVLPFALLLSCVFGLVVLRIRAKYRLRKGVQNNEEQMQ